MLKYLRRHRWHILLILLVTVFIYSIRIFNYTISLDTEFHISNNSGNTKWWISLGRWGLVLIEKILYLRRGFNPMLANFIMVIFFAASVVLLGYIFSRAIKTSNQSRTEAIILFILAAFVLPSPLFAEQFAFTLQTAEISIGLFLTILATFCADLAILSKNKTTPKIRRLTTAATIILLTLVIGIYQSFLPLFIALCATVFILRKLFYPQSLDTTTKENIVIIVKFLAVSVICYLLSRACVWFSLQIFKATETSYLSSQITWGKIPFKESLHGIVDYTRGIIFPSTYSAFFNHTYFIAIVASALISLHLLIKQKQKSTFIILALILVTFSPLLLAFILGSGLLVRVQLTLPFAVAAIFIIAYLYINKISPKNSRSKIKPIAIFSIFIICAISAVSQSKNVADMFYSDYLRYEEDARTMQSIMTKIDLLDYLPNKNRKDTKIVFLGGRRSRSSGYLLSGEAMGYSYFVIDSSTTAGINSRAHAFAATLGYKYKEPSKKDITKARAESKDVPSYPARDSIFIVEDMVVVKMSD